jgi:hypothetical protein
VLFKWKIWAAYAYLAGLMGGSLGYSWHLMSHNYATFCDMNICSRGYGGRRMLYNGGGGGGRARSHCRFIRPLIHFTPDSLTYSVPLFLKRQCDRTPGGGYGYSSLCDSSDPSCSPTFCSSPDKIDVQV